LRGGLPRRFVESCNPLKLMKILCWSRDQTGVDPIGTRQVLIEGGGW